jgi:hypothetical protein
MISGKKAPEHRNGNYGAPKVQAKKESLDLTKEILSRDNLRIPNPDESFTRLCEAYNTTDDARLKAGLWEILKRRRATLQPIITRQNERPDSPYWENVRRVRG